MNHRLATFIIGLILMLPTQAAQKTTAHKSNATTAASFFNHAMHEDLYWEALVQVANGNKDAALRIVDAIKTGTPTTHHCAWKDDTPTTIDSFFDKLFIASIRHDPQALSELGLFESIGINDHNAHLTPLSAHKIMHDLKEAKANLARLQAYSRDALSEDQQVSYDIFSWILHHTVAGERFLYHAYIINQMEGALMSLTVLLTQFHILKTVEDAEHYIARLHKIPEQLHQAIEFMELQKSKGILPPRFTIEKVIRIIEKSIPKLVRSNLFYTHLEEQLHKIDGANCDALLQKTYDVLTDAVYPAYQNLHRYFTQLLEHAQTNHGVWALPDGDAYYAHKLYYHTTTNLSADEIHALGLEEVANIHAQMRSIIANELGVNAEGNIGALVQELSKDPGFYYPNTQESRAQCLADYQAILERSRKELAHLFDLKPRTGVAIKQVPAHEEEGAPGAYYFAPSADGSRPGMFFANLRDMNEIPKYSMETLTIHEAEPGHHFQLALQYEMNMPTLRKLGVFNAYCEGWALYAEKLAYEHGFYSSPFAKLGHLKDELMRAARLVIDTGIHQKRWTREQAIAYMEEVTGYHRNTVISEIERYFVLPGQACSYKIGQLKILALRQQAKDALGEAFDIREFHNEVLQLGCAPLTVLEEVIERYIKKKLNA
jgi:uncharacterized protein (DUF885 family)